MKPINSSLEKNLVKVGVVGASGYIGELLVRMLSTHPKVDLEVVTSRNYKGKKVDEVIPFLRGRCSNLYFSDSDPEKLGSMESPDLFFLALPHGVASEFARPLLKSGKTVIDLSADFRINSTARYEEFYGHPHPAPDLLQHSFYVIPEIANQSWKDAKLIASPGCYPTSILVPLIPLLRKDIVAREGIVINSFSGVSGAGKKATEFFSFGERNESSTAYGIPKHRHLSEIEEQCIEASGSPVVVQFSPHLAPMTKGIATTIVAKAKANNVDEIYKVWERTYVNSKFVTLLRSGTFPDTAHVIGSNRIDISAVYDPRTGNVVITSALDNLMKGAGGQAIQSMNIINGFEEDEGLTPF
ncbi:MAG: N-acetyl-gamma-glutamyl-phosphate reductase [Candidatus Moanabacter tarae]|uniref:N-acetyl-gamma-glutamyl-phosphate reductase n=1 Tax=Candidatus Moanibacter tarae TaxID=2200854 RepID=A0A2Z4AFH9_9BACT|nr:MAG: N-acetyl-gamma-glutamyl-phosphate reductase [Candidatus Moanabacter tarae]|tara:strand:- start:8444 stop:9511 length:1068 start_codon:yes stop_codon:yes gene_type:complete